VPNKHAPPITHDVRYRLATTADRGTIATLLDVEKLPSGDLASSGVILLLAEIDTRVVGCVGIEPYGESGLIRSLCITPDCRRRGIARALVQRAEALALNGGIRTLYLLTDTAADFWRAHSYEMVARETAPTPIRASAEFANLCPVSAVCMRRGLSSGMRKSDKSALSLQRDPSGARFWALTTPRAQLTYYDVPAGTIFPTHFHDGEQITYVLEGVLSFHGDEGTLAVHAGEAVVVPAGARHSVTAGPNGARAVDAWSYPLDTYQIKTEI